MKTAQEITYDFMLALASNMPHDYLGYIEKYPEDADEEAEKLLGMAQTLTRIYLGSL
jgi:hypothetical protein